MGTPQFLTIDRRKIAFEIFGSGSTKAIFFHGFPGTREQGRLLAPFTERFDLQILTFDRPGYGDSDFARAKEGLKDVGRDVLALADSQGWDKFHLLAVSGGAPYAINLAASSGRILSLNVVCGLGPLEDLEFQALFSAQNLKMMKFANLIPSWIITRIVKRRLKSITRKESRKSFFSGLDPADQEILTQPKFQAVMKSSLASAFNQGASGAKQDLRNYLKKWPTDWHQIHCPTHFWHGDADKLVPTKFSELFCARIPNAKLHIIKGEGHYSLPLKRQAEILEQIK